MTWVLHNEGFGALIAEFSRSLLLFLEIREQWKEERRSLFTWTIVAKYGFILNSIV
jgi:hypothetical protein